MISPGPEVRLGQGTRLSLAAEWRGEGARSVQERRRRASQGGEKTADCSGGLRL